MMERTIALLAWAALAGAVPAGAQKRGFDVVPGQPGAAGKATLHALLIGIDDYAAVDHLQNAVRDTQAVAAVLQRDYGFQVSVLTDEKATRQGILDRLQATRSLGPNDDLLVYYSGHGFLDQSGRAGYWVPADGERGRLSSYVSHLDVKKLLGDCPARHILLISDSCFSGQLTRSGEREIAASLVADLRRRRSREIITSGGASEAVADGGYRGHSVFAHHLLRLLTHYRGALPAMNLHAALVSRLTADEYSPQRPAYGRFDVDHDEDGGFVLVPERGGPAPPPSLQDGVPLGWRLPTNYAVERSGDHFFYSKRTGNDPGRMVLVLPGTFEYGGDASRREDRVDAPFLIDEREVTVERFARFVREHRPADLTAWGAEHYADPRQPVVGVTLRTAKAFAQWAGKLIPDEIHWEYAAAWDAGAKQHRTYPWGAEFDAGHIVRYLYPPRVDDPGNAADVSPWGALGMGSGVREWCLLPAPDSFDVPAGAAEEVRHRRVHYGVLRGATQVYSGRTDLLRRTTRYREEAPAEDFAARNIGFRCIVFLERWNG